MAHKAGCSTKSIQRALSGRRPSLRVQRELAAALGQRLESIWEPQDSGDPTLGGRVRRRRLHLGLSQNDVIARAREHEQGPLPLSEETLRRIERNQLKRRPQDSTIAALCQVLDLDPHDWWSDYRADAVVENLKDVGLDSDI